MHKQLGDNLDRIFSESAASQNLLLTQYFVRLGSMTIQHRLTPYPAEPKRWKQYSKTRVDLFTRDSAVIGHNKAQMAQGSTDTAIRTRQ